MILIEVDGTFVIYLAERDVTNFILSIDFTLISTILDDESLVDPFLRIAWPSLIQIPTEL